MKRLLTAFVTPLLLAALLAGCTSAEERLDQGRELQASGQAADAARRYVQALRQDPGLTEARHRLRVSGHDAVQAYLAQAKQDRARGDAIAEAGSYLAADALLLAARGVQVTLEVDGNYAVNRRRALDDAIARQVDDAAALAANGQWDTAMQRLDGVARFEPSADQAAATARTRLHTLRRWAEAELAAGRHRSALELAGQGLDAAADPAMRTHFQAIADEAVRRGTVRVAFLPLAGAQDAARSRAFVAAVNDALELEHWLEHPLLVEPVDPRRVRRSLGPATARSLDARRAAGVARRLQADYAVIATLDDFRVEEAGVREREQAARTRGGKQVHHTRRSGTLRLHAEARFRIITAAGERRTAAFRVNASRSTPFTRSTYRGDHRRLDISRREAQAFIVDADRVAAEQQLADDLAARLAGRMFEEIEKQIP